MTERRKQQLLTCLIATVWFVNGLFCKVLNLVPRHQEIVANILDTNHAREWTMMIGFLEIAMAVWILSRLWIRFNALIQIIIIALMNTLEYVLVPNLLLWGRLNSLWAFLFLVLISYNGLRRNKKPEPA